MSSLKKLLFSVLIGFSALFLFSKNAQAGCTNFKPTNPGAAQAYPVACADTSHWCESTQECAFNQYNTAPSPASGTTTTNSSKLTCVTNGTPGINTAIGCISTDLAGGGLVNSVLGLAIGLGGAAALMLMLYGFYVLTTSAGIPDKVKAGQEVITSAVAGLLFIIFAVVLMNLIGIKILNLPGL